jgi:hypothetical protein
VIPVILRACDWQNLPFGKLRATPTDGKPIRLFTDLDSAFLEVLRDVKDAAIAIHAPNARAPFTPASLRQYADRQRCPSHTDDGCRRFEAD